MTTNDRRLHAVQAAPPRPMCEAPDCNRTAGVHDKGRLWCTGHALLEGRRPATQAVIDPPGTDPWLAGWEAARGTLSPPPPRRLPAPGVDFLTCWCMVGVAFITGFVLAAAALS